jgi:putative hydrolase of HD superfamily
VASLIRHAVREYEEGLTTDARCARDADKLECLVQAVEYRAMGNTLISGWIDSSRRALTTQTAKRVADAAYGVSPVAWREG